MILYVLAALLLVGGVLLLFGANLAAFAVFGGAGILGVIAYRAERERRDSMRRNHVR